jgi:dolichyl-phosphate-mannose-protein mannosyltransferase
MPDRVHGRLWTPELFVLLALAALAHFWQLFTPNAVLFDELHYEHFAGRYLTGTFYFDVHPPLAGMLYGAEAKLFGISGDSLLAGRPAVSLRVLPALLGTLFIPLVYLICRQLGAARRVAMLAGFAVLCENALLVDSRHILPEPMLIGFGLAAICLMLGARLRRGGARLALLAGAATTAGLALSVKWTGASALAIVLTVWFLDSLRARGGFSRIAREGAMLVAIPALVYAGVFALHFQLLPRYGDGIPYLSMRFHATLPGDGAYDSTAHLSFAAKLYDLHHAMNEGNRALEHVKHDASSPWYTWPIMKHPIGLWLDDGPPKRMIILLGNPVLWWGSLLAVAVAIVLMIRRRRMATPHALLFLAGAFEINFAPFMAIKRIMYIYHYLFALIFVIALAIMSLAAISGWNDGDDDALWQFPSRWSRRLYFGVAALIFIGFAYFAPFTYGWGMSERMYEQRMWVLHPRI